MDVTSFQFLGFAALAAGLYNLRRELIWRQAILLLANVAFLASMVTGWKTCLPLAMFLVAGYGCIRVVGKSGTRFLFLPLTVGFVIVFAWLKRYTFIPAALFLPGPYATIGLSYIFFRVMHMIVDARDGSLPVPVGFIPYLNYTLNFTTLIAGPIQLYPDFAASQLSLERPSLTIELAASAMERIVIGLFKLRVLSPALEVLHATAIRHFSGGERPLAGAMTAAIVAVSYPVYLYFNFSGYVDLMIGVARFLRFGLPENFDRPFSATSFIEFWSRWHMTLSALLRTYVYTPLVKSLMRRFPTPAVEPFLGVFAFFVTFFLVGVWHGQTSEFLAFGLLQGAGVSLNKLYQILMGKTLGRRRFKAVDVNPVYRALSRGLTFSYFTFTLIFFWSNWAQIHRMAAALNLMMHMAVWLAIWFFSTGILAAWEAVRTRTLGLQWDGSPVVLAPPVRVAWAFYLALITLAFASRSNTSGPILYQIF